MKKQRLDQEADRLLAQVERDPTAPHYSEDTFRRKMIRAGVRESQLPLPHHLSRPKLLIKSEFQKIVELSNLTDNQRSVLAMRLSGMTFEQVGEARGHTKQAAQNIFNQAAKKIVVAWKEYSMSGLAEVYESEMHRGWPVIRRQVRH